MEFEDIIVLILFVFIFILSILNCELYDRVKDLENKISGNCIYTNNEFYCKD